jgi:hypothetical protein
MAERKGDWAVLCWSGRWCELSRHHTRQEAQAARARRVEAGDNAKRTLVVGPFDTLPREPRERNDRPASGWTIGAKFHRDQSGRA